MTEALIPFIAAGSVVAVFLLTLTSIAARYKKVGPNEVMIISGMKHTVVGPDGTKEKVGYRIRKGGGAFVIPLLEKMDILSLELLTLDVETPEVITAKGVPVIVDGVAQIKVRGDDQSIRTASEQFLSKGQEEIMRIALQTVEGHLRAILGTMTVENIYQNRDQFAQNVQDVAASDLANMGLQIVSFTLRNIRDQHGYLDALGKPRTAEVKRDAQALADRDAIKAAEAARGVRQDPGQTQIAEAEDVSDPEGGYDLESQQKRAEADLSYDLKYKTGQLVKKEEVQVHVVEKEMEIQVQEKEILRRERELDASVKKPAEAEKYKIEVTAEAQRYKYEAEAKGLGEATKLKGFAEADVSKARGTAEAEVSRVKGQANADVIKATGLSEAEIIRAKGEAEAEAMKKKAGSFREYNEAAVVQMVSGILPEIAKAVSEPLSKVEKIAIVSTDALGASKIPGDVARIIASLPPVVESLTGVNLGELMGKLPKLGAKDDKPGEPPQGEKPST
ncbi:MAG: SPFH domain-containing protein [Acidobacteriota bacterium]